MGEKITEEKAPMEFYVVKKHKCPYCRERLRGITTARHESGYYSYLYCKNCDKIFSVYRTARTKGMVIGVKVKELSEKQKTAFKKEHQKRLNPTFTQI